MFAARCVTRQVAAAIRAANETPTGETDWPAWFLSTVTPPAGVYAQLVRAAGEPVGVRWAVLLTPTDVHPDRAPQWALVVDPTCRPFGHPLTPHVGSVDGWLAAIGAGPGTDVWLADPDAAVAPWLTGQGVPWIPGR